MFGWLKKKARKEEMKLLYQNAAASQLMLLTYENDGDTENMALMAMINQTNRKIASQPKISADDLNFLLTANRQLRNHYDDHKSTKLMKMAMSMMSKPNTETEFDKKFVPILGWDVYYQNNGN